ncbi:3-phosphoshikimate 1-carboxyvinyltransferase [Eubacteriaceae bacterium CHKCI005]|nr:3-phosphoshikimate 1-carboxyvinyltransferase [Eubacteriaceae bacterium CHKCI005]
MSSVTVTPGRLEGTLTPPPSKSAAHRAILGAALCKGISTISPIALSDDITATLEAIRSLGAVATLKGDALTVDGSHTFSRRDVTIDCMESGSTLRFLIPVAAAGGVSAEFVGRGRLPERPIGIYLDCLPPCGVQCTTQGGLPLHIQGKLQPGVFSLPGDVSSQFITGLLYALPLLEEESRIVLTTPLQSAGYVDMTIHTLAQFGIAVEQLPDGYRIPGGQQYQPGNIQVEADWSQAAFFLAAGALGGDITLEGLLPLSAQGDREAAHLFTRYGALVSWSQGKLSCRSKFLCHQEIDASDIPDLVPILAVTAALASGETRISGAARLRIKESDRLATTQALITALGGHCRQFHDGLVIRGIPALSGGQVDGAGDHRIVMAAAIAALRASSPVTILGTESVNKSYPAFFEDFKTLGGQIQFNP